MAREIKLRFSIRTKIISLLIASNSMLSACVSTEELYADYDAANCNLVQEQTSDGEILFRELLSNSLFQWEPAVYFGFDQHELSKTELKRLNPAITVLKKYPQLLVSLQGLTDQTGSKSYNFALAGRRVESVKSYLISNGIAESRQIAQPFGAGFAHLGANDKESRANNRRVELMLLSENGRPIKRATKIVEEIKK